MDAGAAARGVSSDNGLSHTLVESSAAKTVRTTPCLTVRVVVPWFMIGAATFHDTLELKLHPVNAELSEKPCEERVMEVVWSAPANLTAPQCGLYLVAIRDQLQRLSTSIRWIPTEI